MIDCRNLTHSRRRKPESQKRPAGIIRQLSRGDMTRSCSRFLGAAGFLFVACTLMAASPPALKGWGQAADPDGDCRFEQKAGKLTIAVPGTLHNLVADSGQVNAPTVLSPVKGEFIAMVKSTGSVRPGPEPTVPDGLPYNGTGLLLWVDRDNYFRLERAGLMRDGAVYPIRQFRAFQGGAPRLQPGGWPPGSSHPFAVGAPRWKRLCVRQP